MKSINKFRHIYWFAPYNLKSPSTRYRGKYPLVHLKEHYNIASDFVFPDRSLKGLRKFFQVFISALLFRKPNSLIVIQKVCSNKFYANALKCLILIQKKNTLYDIDDAEYCRNKMNTLHFFLRFCESVVVGSNALLDYCSRFNKNVYLNTSPIPNHGKRKIRKKEKLSIGWVGDFGNGDTQFYSFSHKKSLYDLFFSPIRKISYPIKLTLIGINNRSDIPEIINFFKDSPN
nr:hypothetical protein [Bacteroidota bacterium]